MGDETEYDVDLATRVSYVLAVATTAATVSVSLNGANDVQVGSTIICNK